jgi:hypothetical protein
MARTLPLTDERVEGFEGGFDRCARVEAVDLVEVDGVYAETTETVFAGLLDVLAPEPAHVGLAVQGEEDLGGDDDFIEVSVFAQHLARDFFARPDRIHVGRVEEIDAGFDGASKEGGGIIGAEHPGAPVGRAVAHAAEADVRNLDSGRAEGRRLHVVAFSIAGASGRVYHQAHRMNRP